MTERNIETLSNGRYRVRFRIGGDRKVSVGTFTTLEEAIRERDRAMRDMAPQRVAGQGWTGEGTSAQGQEPDEDEVYERARRQWTKTATRAAQKASQRLIFEGPAVGLVFLADQHLGSPGTDIVRAMDEAEIVAGTEGLFAVMCGDLLDNFIIGKLKQARDGSRVTVSDEWALARRYLKIVAPKLVLSVAGNHDYWTELLSAVPYFREALAAISPGTLYDADEARVEVRLGEYGWRLRVRHKWNGSSIYNPTHGQEKAAKFDQDADILVGAHTHVSGVVRSFNNGGKTGLAVQCGAYKIEDRYAIRQGFSRPNQSTAVCVVLTADGEMVGVESLDLAAKIVTALRT